jgi:hypothetical protein
MVYGFTPDGRYIVVVYEEIDNHTLCPVTAYVVVVHLTIAHGYIGQKRSRVHRSRFNDRHHADDQREES